MDKNDMKKANVIVSKQSPGVLRLVDQLKHEDSSYKETNSAVGEKLAMTFHSP